MQPPFGPRVPDRRQGRRPPSRAGGGQRAEPSRLMPQPWPGVPPRPTGGSSAPGPAYLPGTAPQTTAPRRNSPRRTLGRTPAARMARTDPTLYQWERLSPEQQQAVLATIKAAGVRRRGHTFLDRRVLAVLLAIAVMVLLLLLLVH